MVLQHSAPVQVENLRIRFYRAYIGDAKVRQPQPAPIGAWLQLAGTLPFDHHPSRYHDTGNSRRVYAEVDQQGPPAKFRLNRTTYRGIPPAELLGNVNLNYLQQDAGLMDTWYGMIFHRTISGVPATFVAIATKGNTAPNVMLRDYIRHKCSDATELQIDHLAHKNILDKLASMGDGTIFEIGIKPSFAEQLKAVDTSLADALQASEKVYPQRELSQVIKPDSASYFALKDRFVNVINFVLGNEQNRTAVTKLRLGGFFGDSNRTTILNLLSNDLSVEVEVPYSDETVAVLDPDTVYSAITDAYITMADAIHEAAEVSEWSTYADSTGGISSGPTHRQPPLWQLA